MTTPFERRTRRCQERLADAGADATVLFPSPNLYYLAGFHEEPMERHLLLFVPPDASPTFVAPTMYREQLRDESWVEDVRTWDDGDDPVALIRDVVDELDLAGGRVLVDSTMWARFTQDLRAAVPDADWGLADEVLAPLRKRKDDAELDAMRRAAAVADEVARDVRALGDDAVGLTETELADDVERRLSAAGGEELSFDVVVGSGPNGAKPHHRHGDRVLERGDPVVLDFGARVDRYPSDQTRTVVFAGDPPDGFEAAFDAVRDAQQAGVEAVEPGVPAEAVDRAARDVIEDRGFGDAFTHRTGHGVGLDVHEEPYVVEGNDEPLEPGMVFSVEPGVYLDGEFGVRVEDLVVVTDDGCERLNDSPRGWRP
jgi:Xaa-Pro aminopeptidase